MKKQLLLLVMILLPMVASADAVEIDGIYYNLVKEAKTAEVTSNPNKYKGVVNIPPSVTYDNVTYDVTSIGNDAFRGCSGLTSVTIPNSVTSIGSYAFYYCSGLTSITIPNSVTSIDWYAFRGCSGLTSVTIPNSVTSIGNYVFCNCSGLTSVTIPNSVTTIGSYAFNGCTGLTSVTIPNSVTSIGWYAFQYCSGLTSVTIPNSVTSIAEGAFDGCSGLTSVTIPNSVTSIGISAFRGCSGLTSVTIPNSVTSIRNYAFSGCSKLESLSIGSGVKNIGSQAFASCAELVEVYCYAESVPTTQSDAFNGSYVEYATLHVPDASVASYAQTAPWSGFKSVIGLHGSYPAKCATPTITVAGGKLTFKCETEGVSFNASYSNKSGNGNVVGNELVLAGNTTCHVSVYATKEGCLDSDIATADVEIVWGKKGDVNQDGQVSITDAVSVVNIILNEGE